HPSRKNIEPLLRGWKLYHDQHPDSVLWLHTLIDADRGGINVTELIRTIGLPSGSLAFTDQFAYFRGLSEARMAQLYWAADALLIPSGGEGFCVPIIEAQSCGIPVLATQYTAMRDHVAAGVLLKTDDPGRSGDFYYVNNYGGEWFRPTAEAIAQAIPVVRQITEDPKTAETARTFALRFDHQYVREHYWKPGLQRIQTIIEGGLR
ncbi:MAG: glycosyltransferase, partial [Anaerolineae bacterium]|nr:glycosyltransferase [Anaerolineae bacterium]